MKKHILSFVAVFAVLMLLSAVSAFAETDPSAADGALPVDPVVGSWRFPASPHGDDFTNYVVLNADGSFLFVNNMYLSGNSGPYTQTVTTNETFTWNRIDRSSIELHYSYLDENGEFVTPLTYEAADDSLYLWGLLYAVRDDSFEPDNR